MHAQGYRGGFTLVELMITVAVIAILTAVGVPKLMTARLSSNENAAIANLRSIAAAQAQLTSANAIDTDADGKGEFGYLGELTGLAPMRKYGPGGPIAGAAPDDLLDPAVFGSFSGEFGGDAAGNGIVEKQGYYYQVWLPGVPAGAATPGVPEAAGPVGGAPGAGGFPNALGAELMWCCYAWPVEAGRTGNRVFFVNQTNDLMQFDNRAAAYSALNGPAFDAALADTTGGGDMGAPLGVTKLGLNANDTNTWTVVGN